MIKSKLNYLKLLCLALLLPLVIMLILLRKMLLKDELAKLSSSISNINGACATNSTSCEASILKENVELRAQFELLTTPSVF